MEFAKLLNLQDNGVPIYVQLRDQIAAAVGSKRLAPGDQLPTMREVAVELRIDLNTVQRAYAELEREGILTMVRGRGSFVTEKPPSRDRRAELRAFAAKVAGQAHAKGITIEDLLDALKVLRERAP
jgi:GntR family transcriptional regulator